MRPGLLFCLMLGGLLMAVPALAAPTISLQPEVLAQGQPVWLRVCNAGQAPALGVRLLGREAPLSRDADGCWSALIAADLDAPPGAHRLEVLANGQIIASRVVSVSARDYGTRRITVDGKYVEPDPAQLARHQEDLAAMRAAYDLRTPQALWSGPWRLPVDSVVVGVFGRRSLVNDQPRSPHGGVDLRAGVGAPIAAPAAGRVACVRDTFFGGLIVLIDHGLGVVSAYRHLSAAQVKAGDIVKPGQVIGLAGMSGRVTGPHLHFDLHWAGARVDPLAFIALSRTAGAPVKRAKQPARPARQ